MVGKGVLGLLRAQTELVCNQWCYLNRFVPETVFSLLVCDDYTMWAQYFCSVLDHWDTIKPYGMILGKSRVRCEYLRSHWKSLETCCILTPDINSKAPMYYFYISCSGQWIVFVESSPSNAALLLLLNCLLMSMCLHPCTHHIKATSLTCPVGIKHLHSSWSTHTGVFICFDWSLLSTVWARIDHVWLICPWLY